MGGQQIQPIAAVLICAWVKECTCRPIIVTRYQKRISGPLLDRIDIHVEVPRVEYETLASDRPLEASESIRVRVEEASDSASSDPTSYC